MMQIRPQTLRRLITLLGWICLTLVFRTPAAMADEVRPILASDVLSNERETALISAAREIWDENKLWPTAIRLESSATDLPGGITRAIARWTRRWDEEMEWVSREDIALELAKLCPQRAGSACASLPHVYKSATPEQQRALAGAVALAKLYRGQGLNYRVGSTLTDMLLENRANCMGFALVSLHLMKKSGITDFRPVYMPDHVTLAITLNNGNRIYFNNGAEILPDDYFRHPPTASAYTPSANERGAEPWTILAGVYLNAGRRFLEAGRLDLAKANWFKAYAINPYCPTTLNNLGLALARSGSWDRAEGFFRESLAINPRYGRARSNLEMAEVAILNIKAGNR